MAAETERIVQCRERALGQLAGGVRRDPDAAVVGALLPLLLPLALVAAAFCILKKA